MQDQEAKSTIQPGRMIREQFVVTEPCGDRGAENEYYVRHCDQELPGRLILSLLSAEASSRLSSEASKELLLDLGQAKHRSLCSRFFIDRDEELGWYFIRQEETGSTLGKLLQSGTRFMAEEAQLLLKDIACAVKELHRRGVNHGRISPDAVKISQEGLAQLSLIEIQEVSGLRMRSEEQEASRGIYCSPEDGQSGKASVLGDLYSIGVIGYQLLSGENDLGGADSEGESGTFFDVSSLSCPQPLREVIHSLLQIDPGRRLQSAELLINCLSPTDDKKSLQSAVSPVAGSGSQMRTSRVEQTFREKEIPLAVRIASATLWFLPICVLCNLAALFLLGISMEMSMMSRYGADHVRGVINRGDLFTGIKQFAAIWWPIPLLCEIAVTGWLGYMEELPGTSKLRKPRTRKMLKRSEIPPYIYLLCIWPLFLYFMGGMLGGALGALAMAASVDVYRQTHSAGIAFVLSLLLGDIAAIGTLVL